MSFLIRPAKFSDVDQIHHLATSLSTYGFLTLPAERDGVESLTALSERSFGNKLEDGDQGRYLFLLEDLEMRRVIGSSLIIARHGTPESPHLFFQVDSEKGTLTFQAETEGRTELGGLILEPEYRGHRAKLGKSLSLIRFLYIKRKPERFCDHLLAELLPPFTREGKSLFWESLGRRLTKMDYRTADEKSRRDKRFVLSLFPRGPILINSLSPEAQATIGVAGPETQPVVKILTSIGFRYLHQIDPFDGGPHYGVKRNEVRYDLVEDFFAEQQDVRWLFEL